MIAFHVVELVMKLIPDLNGDLGDLSEDIFGIISCYFPISFNPVSYNKVLLIYWEVVLPKLPFSIYFNFIFRGSYQMIKEV